MGARKIYTEAEIKKFKATIIEKLSKGKSLLQILKAKSMPSRRYVYEWLNPNHERFDSVFSNNYAQAREDSADLDVEKMEQIVEDVRNDKLRPDQARAMADILKWTAGRKKPKKYGHKIDHTTGGKEIHNQVVVFEIPDNGRDEFSNEETED